MQVIKYVKVLGIKHARASSFNLNYLPMQVVERVF